MAILIRKHGNESYFKPSTATVKQMISFGLIDKYSSEGYCNESEDVPTNRLFAWKGNVYKIEYFSGCFYPFLLQIQLTGEDFLSIPNEYSDISDRAKENIEDVKQKYLLLERNGKRPQLIQKMDYYFKDRVMTPSEAKSLLDVI